MGYEKVEKKAATPNKVVDDTKKAPDTKPLKGGTFADGAHARDPLAGASLVGSVDKKDLAGGAHVYYGVVNRGKAAGVAKGIKLTLGGVEGKVVEVYEFRCKVIFDEVEPTGTDAIFHNEAGQAKLAEDAARKKADGEAARQADVEAEYASRKGR